MSTSGETNRSTGVSLRLVQERKQATSRSWAKPNSCLSRRASAMMRSRIDGRYSASAKFRCLFSEIGLPSTSCCWSRSFQTRIWSSRMLRMSSGSGIDECVRLTLCSVGRKCSRLFRREMSNSRSLSLREHDLVPGPAVAGLKARHAGQVDLEIDRLVAVVFERPQQAGQILRPPATVELRQPQNGLGEDRMQPRIEGEQVPAAGDERFQVARLIQIEAAREAGQDQSQAEDVGQRIVMPQFMLPRDIARQG